MTLSCAYPLTELHQTQFPGLLQAIPPKLGVGNRKIPLLADCPRFWRFFCVFSADSETTLSCAYPSTELHQTRFLGFLQVIPPESSVGNGKIPLLADCPGFWSFFGRLGDDAVLRLPLDLIASNSVSWAFAGHLPESSVGNWKIPLLADCPGIGVFFVFSKEKLDAFGTPKNPGGGGGGGYRSFQGLEGNSYAIRGAVRELSRVLTKWF